MAPDARMSNELKAIHVIISGRVQGVWFRAWTQKAALKLGLTGWVRNRTDGTVEALLCGRSEQLEAMIAKCRKGPTLARVDKISQTPAEPPAESGFNLLPTT